MAREGSYIADRTSAILQCKLLAKLDLLGESIPSEIDASKYFVNSLTTKEPSIMTCF